MTVYCDIEAHSVVKLEERKCLLNTGGDDFLDALQSPGWHFSKILYSVVQIDGCIVFFITLNFDLPVSDVSVQCNKNVCNAKGANGFTHTWNIHEVIFDHSVEFAIDFAESKSLVFCENEDYGGCCCSFGMCRLNNILDEHPTNFGFFKSSDFGAF